MGGQRKTGEPIGAHGWAGEPRRACRTCRLQSGKSAPRSENSENNRIKIRAGYQQGRKEPLPQPAHIGQKRVCTQCSLLKDLKDQMAGKRGAQQEEPGESQEGALLPRI